MQASDGSLMPVLIKKENGKDIMASGDDGLSGTGGVGNMRCHSGGMERADSGMAGYYMFGSGNAQHFGAQGEAFISDHN